MMEKWNGGEMEYWNGEKKTMLYRSSDPIIQTHIPPSPSPACSKSWYSSWLLNQENHENYKLNKPDKLYEPYKLKELNKPYELNKLFPLP